MTNIVCKQDGDKLIITLDLSQAKKDAALPSSTGKTRLVASTHGKQNFNGVAVSLNAYIAA